MSVVVVSDASPLNYLIQIEAAHVLPEIFDEIIIPSAVLDEVRHARAPEVVRAWSRQLPPWVILENPKTAPEFGSVLGRGEAHAITLACEKAGSLVLLDDRAARKIASEKGLSFIGTIGVLEIADAKNILDLRGALKRLLQTNFRIDANAVETALARSARRKGTR